MTREYEQVVGTHGTGECPGEVAVDMAQTSVRKAMWNKISQIEKKKEEKRRRKEEKAKENKVLDALMDTNDATDALVEDLDSAEVADTGADTAITEPPPRVHVEKKNIIDIFFAGDGEQKKKLSDSL